jgi:hypothetical protein
MSTKLETQLDKFIEDESVSAKFSRQDMANGAYKLKPMVLKLAEALNKYKNQSCSAQTLDMAAL